MKPPRFNEEDIVGMQRMSISNIACIRDITIGVNKRVDEWVASCQTVYQYKGKGADWSHTIDEDFGGIKKYTHTAKLFCIEEIAKPVSDEELEFLSKYVDPSCLFISSEGQIKAMDIIDRLRKERSK